MPDIDYSLNVATLDRKAREREHITRDGRLNLRRISRHAGLDIAVVSRTVSKKSRPQLGTVIALHRAYSDPGEPLDQWVSVVGEAA